MARGRTSVPCALSRWVSSIRLKNARDDAPMYCAWPSPRAPLSAILAGQPPLLCSARSRAATPDGSRQGPPACFPDGGTRRPRTRPPRPHFRRPPSCCQRPVVTRCAEHATVRPCACDGTLLFFRRCARVPDHRPRHRRPHLRARPRRQWRQAGQQEAWRGARLPPRRPSSSRQRPFPFPEQAVR